MPGQQQRRPALTPALNAFKSLANLAGNTLEKLAAQQQSCTPEQRLAKLRENFAFFDSLRPAPGVVEKITSFLTALNQSAQSTKLAEELKRINDSQGDKLTELKKLLKNEEVILACAKEWNLYIDSLYGNKEQEIKQMFREYNAEAVKVQESVSGQGNFDPEKKIVKDFLRLLFGLFNMVLIQAGYEVPFASNDGPEQGRWDSKSGTVLGKEGVRVPH